MVNLFPRTTSEFHLFSGVPRGFPLGHPHSGVEKIPSLKRINRNQVPDHLIRFDDLGRGMQRDPRLKVTGVHFYADDARFTKFLVEPGRLIYKVRNCSAILTPDISISADMPPWRRVGNTSLSRAVGAIWESRGLTVIPSLRWRDSDDYDYVASGIPNRSIFAVSTFGSVENPSLKLEFTKGLTEMIRRLSPVAVMVFGIALGDLNERLGTDTEFIYYPTETQKLSSAKFVHDSSLTIF